MRLLPRLKNISDTDKDLFNSYLEEKLRRISPILEDHYPDSDAVTVDVRLERFNKHNAYSFQITIDMPHGKFLAAEVKHNIKEVMDIVMDKIELQLNKHFKKLARE